MAGIPADGSRLRVVWYARRACDVLRLEGELDLSTAERVRQALAPAPASRSGRRHLVLDLRRLQFVDSSGLGALFQLHRRVVARGGRTLVARPTPTVERVLRLSGFFKLAGRAGSVDEAVHVLEEDG